MKVGNTPPTVRDDWMRKKHVWRFLACCDYLAAKFFYYFNTVAIVRFAVESVAVLALLGTIVGVFLELQHRGADRGVRIATLFTQIAQIRPDRTRPYDLSSKKFRTIRTSVEALAREGVSMFGVDLRDADLRDADLEFADFTGADLSFARLTGARLRGADLEFARLTGADFRNAIDLFPAQLTSACAAPKGPPLLSSSLEWKENPCPERTEGPSSTWDPPLPQYP